MSWMPNIGAWLGRGEYRPAPTVEGLEELERRLDTSEEPVDSTLRFGDASFIVNKDIVDPALHNGIEPRDRAICLQFAQLVSDHDYRTATCQRRLGDLSLEKLLITLGDLQQEEGNQDGALTLYEKVNTLAHGAFCTNALRGLEMKKGMSQALAAQERRARGDVVGAAADVDGLTEQLSQMVLKDLTGDEVRKLVAAHERVGEYDQAVALLEKLNKGNIDRDAHLFKELVNTLARYELQYFQGGNFSKAQEMYTKLASELSGAAGFYLYSPEDLEDIQQNFIGTGRFADLFNLVKVHAKRDTARIVEAGLLYGQMAYEDASQNYEDEPRDLAKGRALAEQSTNILLEVLGDVQPEVFDSKLDALFFCLDKTNNKRKMLEILTRYTQDDFRPLEILLRNSTTRKIIFETPELLRKLNEYFMEAPALRFDASKMFYAGVLRSAERPEDAFDMAERAKGLFIHMAKQTTPPPKAAPRHLLGLVAGSVPRTEPYEVKTAVDHYLAVLELCEMGKVLPGKEDLEGWIKELIRLYKVSNQASEVEGLLKRVSVMYIEHTRALTQDRGVPTQEDVADQLVPFINFLKENELNDQALSFTKVLIQKYERTFFSRLGTHTREVETQLDGTYSLLLETAFSITSEDPHMHYLAGMYHLKRYYRQKEASHHHHYADAPTVNLIYNHFKAAFEKNPKTVPEPLLNTARYLYYATLYDFTIEINMEYPRDAQAREEVEYEYLQEAEGGTISLRSDHSTWKSYYENFIKPRLEGKAPSDGVPNYDTKLFHLDGKYPNIAHDIPIYQLA
ncbi:MAG: hypothetical protein S4CHLAM37_03710 [Chlamydiia bacterium]|nr:hypothetical protein [Chlamydiia bacterium]